MKPLSLTCCPNLRDLGDLPTQAGLRIRPRRLIRAGALHEISAEEAKSLGKLLAIFDLRSETERRFKPDPNFGADYYHMPLTEKGRRKLIHSKKTLEDKVVDIIAGYNRGENLASVRMRKIYRSIVLSHQTANCLEQIIHILNAEPEGAVLWHCSVGKDRAGVIAAILLRLLTVPEELIYEDYLYTNVALQHELEEAESLAFSLSGDPAVASYVKGFFAACPCWLKAALDTVDHCGSVEQYLLQNTKLEQADFNKFRAACLY